MNQIDNHIRGGNFSSSGIAALMSNGKQIHGLGAPALTYIEEKNFERKLGRWLNAETSSRPTSWGSLVEGKVFELLGTEYQFAADKTKAHPTIEGWVGSPDCIKYDEGKTVVDIKSPMTLKSFCQLVECKTFEDLLNLNKDYAYQLISNGIITGSKYAELITYVPYKEDLESIRAMADNEQFNQDNVKWIYYSTDEQLPYLNRGGYYKDLNVLRFEIPAHEIEALTERVKLCLTMLIERPKYALA